MRVKRSPSVETIPQVRNVKSALTVTERQRSPKERSELLASLDWILIPAENYGKLNLDFKGGIWQ